MLARLAFAIASSLGLALVGWYILLSIASTVAEATRSWRRRP